MSTLHPAITITDLAKSSAWPAIKKERVVTVAIDGKNTRVELATCPSPVGGDLLYLLCRKCHHRRRELFVVDGELACKKCHGLPLHPDHQLSSGRFSQKVVRKVWQVRRLEARLAKPGPDKNTRRRLRRRRRRLLDKLKQELARQRHEARDDLSLLLGQVGIQEL